MCRKVNKQDPRSLVAREWQTTLTIMRREDSTAKYGTEFVGIVLVKLFCTEYQMLLSFICRMRHRVAIFVVCNLTRMDTICRWAHMG